MRTIVESSAMNKILQSILSIGFSYAADRLVRYLGKRAQSPAVAAIETAVNIGRQLVIGGAESYSTPESLIVALKGVVAIQLARVGIYEEQAAAFKPLVDVAISKVVTEWYERTGSRARPPILDKLAARGAVKR